MTRIIGQINDSGGLPLNCKVEVIIPGGTVDRLKNPPAWNLAVATVYDCPSGAVSFDLAPTFNQTYQFRIYTATFTETWRSADGSLYQGLKHYDAITGLWYTGAAGNLEREPLSYASVERRQDVVPAFYAAIPSRGNVNIADLQPSGITPTNIDTSLLAIADLLVTRPEYLNQIVAAIQAAT